jgi:hypothetical protein
MLETAMAIAVCLRIVVMSKATKTPAIGGGLPIIKYWTEQTIVYIATKPNIGHFHGLASQNTLILPVFARFENPHATTVESGNNFVRLNSPGTIHLDDTDIRSEVELLAEIADRIHGNNPINWHQLQDPLYIRQLIAQVIPGYSAIATIDATKAEFTVAGRIFDTPEFPTTNGKAQMFFTPLPQLNLPLITGHSSF